MASSSRSSRGSGPAGARGLASGESGGLSVTHSHQLLQKVLVVATPAGPRRWGCRQPRDRLRRLLNECQCLLPELFRPSNAEGVISTAPASLDSAMVHRCEVCACRAAFAPKTGIALFDAFRRRTMANGAGKQTGCCSTSRDVCRALLFHFACGRSVRVCKRNPRYRKAQGRVVRGCMLRAVRMPVLPT